MPGSPCRGSGKDSPKMLPISVGQICPAHKIRLLWTENAVLPMDQPQGTCIGFWPREGKAVLQIAWPRSREPQHWQLTSTARMGRGTFLASEEANRFQFGQFQLISNTLRAKIDLSWCNSKEIIFSEGSCRFVLVLMWLDASKAEKILLCNLFLSRLITLI